MDNSFIITPDKMLSVATNWISRYDSKIDDDPNNNIYFIKPDYMKVFNDQVLSKINYPFVMITHDSDIPAPVPEYESILENPYLIKWFGMNCNVIHDKLQPIPIGMANECWEHGNKDIITNNIKQNNPKDNLVYCNFDINTNVLERQKCLQLLSQFDFIDYETNKLNFEDYINKLSTYKYVISPPGNSVDCHRIWESMYVKTIPICLKQIPLVYFKDCPIKFINNWSCISSQELIEDYDIIKSKSDIKSDFNYYTELINSTALKRAFNK